jgi:hypothetical protein
LGTVGNNWTAMGFQSGKNMTASNVVAIGTYAGLAATGKNKLFVDVYQVEPTGINPTNDMIYGDNGQLNLGRTGSGTNSTPNRLRGLWLDDSGSQIATKAYVDTATGSGDWSCLSLGLAMGAVDNVTHAWMGNYSGATYGVIGTSGANSNQTYNAVFHGVCPPNATATNLVTEALWQSPDSIDGQVIYATIIDYDNVGGNNTFSRSLSVASGLTSLTWTQSVNTVTTKLIQTTSGNVADTAANRVLVRVRTKWIE